MLILLTSAVDISSCFNFSSGLRLHSFVRHSLLLHSISFFKVCKLFKTENARTLGHSNLEDFISAFVKFLADTTKVIFLELKIGTRLCPCPIFRFSYYFLILQVLSCLETCEASPLAALEAVFLKLIKCHFTLRIKQSKVVTKLQNYVQDCSLN